MFGSLAIGIVVAQRRSGIWSVSFLLRIPRRRAGLSASGTALMLQPATPATAYRAPTEQCITRGTLSGLVP